MTKNIAFKEVNQGTPLVTGTLPLTPLVIEGLEDFKGSFDRLCLRAGTAAIEAMLAGDVAQLCGQRSPRVKVYCPRTVRWQRAGYLPYGVGVPPVRPKNFSQEVPQRALVRRERGGCTVVFFLLLPFIRWQHRGQDREPSHCEQWQRTTFRRVPSRCHGR